jgi:hypothetical protein
MYRIILISMYLQFYQRNKFNVFLSVLSEVSGQISWIFTTNRPYINPLRLGLEDGSAQRVPMAPNVKFSQLWL